MTLHTNIFSSMMAGSPEVSHELNVVFKEITDDGDTYFVAECLEIPGCVSQGDTREEVEKNIESALRDCISVLFDDCLAKVVSSHGMPDLRGITSQKKFSIASAPQLEYA